MSIVGDILNGGRNAERAAGRAADAANESSRLAIGEQRRQFDFIQDLLAPFVQSGADNLALAQEGATLDGIDSRLGDIFNSDIFTRVRDERINDATNAFAQAGLSRSGGAIEDLTEIPIETALQLENTIFGRQSGLSQNGQNAASGLGATAFNTGSNIANLINQQGSNTASAILQGQQARAGHAGNLLNTGLAAGLAFSDPELKKNMKPIGRVADLTMYEWEWVEGMPRTENQMTLGYDAEEVAQKYPHHVTEIHGFKAINYPALNSELESKLLEEVAA